MEWINTEKNIIIELFKKEPNGFYAKYGLDNKYKVSSKEEAIKLAISKAYAPSTRRALSLDKGVKTNAPRSTCEEYLYNAIILNIDKIKSVEDYDKFAKECCSHLRKEFQEYGISDYTYGNAQKWLGMIFKYLLSCEEIRKNYDVFDFCFIPVDSIIIKKAQELGVKFESKSWSKCDSYEHIRNFNINLMDKVGNDYPSLIYWECIAWDK